ncbi:MAG: hypothetical protein ACI4XJ_09995 [Eubacteriales bacterium]
MKRFLLVLLVSTLLLSSCGRSKAAELSSESGISRYTGVSDSSDTELTYPATYIRTDVYGEDSSIYPRTAVISTRDELEKYTSDNESTYDFATHTYSIGFYDAVTKYNESFFEKSSLVMIILKEDASCTHGNRGFSKTDSGYTANLIRFTTDPADDSPAVWHIIFELPKSSPVLDGEIKIDITEESAE